MAEFAPIRAVTFDLDGLMFNTEQLYDIVMHELCRRRELEFDDVIRARMMGRPGEYAFVEMIDYYKLGESPSDMLVESDLIFTKILEERLAPMPGTADLLSALESAGIPKGIATSSRRKYVDYVLSRMGWNERFDFLITSENVTNGKPHPEIYQSAALRHGISTHEMLVLEDSQNGCRAAVASGAFAVAVPGDHSRTHDFTGARFIAESLADERIYHALNIPRSA